MKRFTILLALLIMGISELMAGSDAMICGEDITDGVDLKPQIVSIDDIQVVNTGEFTFSLSCNVKYTGADYVTVEIEEEYNTSLMTHRYDEPDIAHIKTGNITNLYYSWVTIKVSNDYGSASETLEFSPTYEVPSSIADNKLTEGVNTDNEIIKTQIFNINGSLMLEIAPDNHVNANYRSIMAPGLYLKNEIYKSGLTQITKIIL